MNKSPTSTQSLVLDPVSRLKNLMADVSYISKCTSASITKPVGVNKTGDDDDGNVSSVLTMLKHQTAYIQQLEKEVTFLREELGYIKESTQEVIEENEALKNDNNKSLIHMMKNELETIKDQVDDNIKKEANVMQERDNEMWQKWQIELDRIRSLHHATSERLEAQVDYLRKELEKKKEETEELKTKLRSRLTDDRVIGSVGDIHTSVLCIKCANDEAILPASSNIHSNTIQQLIRDKEEMSGSLAQARRNAQEIQLREDEAHDQVKKSVILVEEAQYEKAKLEIENVNLKKDLKREEERMKEIIGDYKVKLKEERDLVVNEWTKRLENLQDKMTEMTDENSMMENTIERVTREKKDLSQQLADTKEDVNELQAQISAMNRSVQTEVLQLRAERDKAEQDLKLSGEEYKRTYRIRQQEHESAILNIDALTKRLTLTESKLIETNEQCIELTKTISDLEKELNLAKLSKFNSEKSRQEDVKSISRQTQLQIEELTANLLSVQAQNANRVNEMDNVIASQNNLLDKMKDECHLLTDKLEQLTHDSWKQKCHSDEEKEKLSNGLKVAIKKLDFLEAEINRQRECESILRQHCDDLEDELQQKSTQVYDLIQKQMTMTHERRHLADEVEFLHTELMNLTSVLPSREQSRNYVRDNEEILE